jgi:hypothetical protein
MPDGGRLSGWGPWLMLQANALRVGLLIGGALAIRVFWLVRGVSTARSSRVQENHRRVGRVARTHCWVLRKRAPVRVFGSSGRFGSSLSG